VDDIIPEIEKLETDDTKEKELVQVTACLTVIIKILKENKYPVSTREVLLESFRALDVEGKGYLDLHTLFSLLKAYGTPLTKSQLKDMESFLVDNDIELLQPLKINEDEDRVRHTQYKTRKFYYEAYLMKINNENKKHFKSLKKEFKLYLEQKTKKE
jgi:hypothetical protein